MDYKKLIDLEEKFKAKSSTRKYMYDFLGEQGHDFPAWVAKTLVEKFEVLVCANFKREFLTV